MTLKKFTLTEYVGRKTLHVRMANLQGIYAIYYWCAKAQCYKHRVEGLKYYGYKKINGVQKTKCFESLRQAKGWRESADLFADDATETEITFKVVKDQYFESKRSLLRISTIETYESTAKHLIFFDNLPMDQITPKTIDVWLTQMKSPHYLALQHRSRLTFQHELSMLKQILEYYSEYLCQGTYPHPIKMRHTMDSIVDKGRHDLAKSRNKFKYLPPAEIERFLAELEARATANPNRLLFWLLALFQLRSGTRIGETCGIDFRDVDFANGTVMVSKTVLWSRKKGRATLISPLTKTGEPRLIYLTDQVLDALVDWKELCGRSKGLVFSQDGFQPITYRAVQHHYDKALMEIGSQWRSTHILRHSFSTDYLERTGDKLGLQGMLGHKHSKQTEHYAKITNSTKRDGMRAYSQSIEDGNSNVISLSEKAAAR